MSREQAVSGLLGSRKARPLSIDVYTKRAIVVDTSEHIIPSFLGGRLGTRGLIDEATNGAFGRGIESALCQELLCFRAMVDGVTDREHASARAVAVRGDDGARYFVAADGSVSRVPTAPKFLRLPNGLHIDASFSGASSGKARKAMEQAVRARVTREGFADPEKLVRQALDAAVSRTDPLPRLNFSTDLYTVPCYRATAKISAAARCTIAVSIAVSP